MGDLDQMDIALYFICIAFSDNGIYKFVLAWTDDKKKRQILTYNNAVFIIYWLVDRFFFFKYIIV